MGRAASLPPSGFPSGLRAALRLKGFRPLVGVRAAELLRTFGTLDGLSGVRPLEIPRVMRSDDEITASNSWSWPFAWACTCAGVAADT